MEDTESTSSGTHDPKPNCKITDYTQAWTSSILTYKQEDEKEKTSNLSHKTTLYKNQQEKRLKFTNTTIEKKPVAELKKLSWSQ